MKTTKEQRAELRLLLLEIPARNSNLPPNPIQGFIDVLDDFDELDALINTAQTADFLEAVKLEAAHQVRRWGPDDREQKSDADWIWLMTYLASKAVFGKDNGAARWVADAARDYARTAIKQGRGLPINVDIDKYRHRIITIAAAAKNWFDNRPFLSPDKRT